MTRVQLSGSRRVDVGASSMGKPVAGCCPFLLPCPVVPLRDDLLSERPVSFEMRPFSRGRTSWCFLLYRIGRRWEAHREG